jgi:hypothetical protein
LLKLEDGAAVDLGRFKHIAARTAQGGDADHSSPKVDADSTTPQIAELPEAASQPNIMSAPTSDHQDNARKRQFLALHFRRRSQNHSVSGPALAVADNDAAATTEGGERRIHRVKMAFAWSFNLWPSMISGKSCRQSTDNQHTCTSFVLVHRSWETIIDRG